MEKIPGECVPSIKRTTLFHNSETRIGREIKKDNQNVVQP